jgi:hypothetical protein
MLSEVAVLIVAGKSLQSQASAIIPNTHLLCYPRLRHHILRPRSNTLLPLPQPHSLRQTRPRNPHHLLFRRGHRLRTSPPLMHLPPRLHRRVLASQSARQRRSMACGEARRCADRWRRYSIRYLCRHGSLRSAP